MNTGIAKLVTAAEDVLFANALPGNLGRYAPQLLNASRKYNVSPWVLAGLLQRESSGGDSLRPRGPAGTGDFSARPAGITYKQSSGASYVVPQNGLPEDGLGWGRGLMQIDYGAHNAWVKSNNWQDPGVNIDKAASLFKSNLDYFRMSAGTGVYVEAWRIDSGLAHAGVQPWKVKYAGRPIPSTTVTVPCPNSPTKRCVGPFPDPRPLSGQALYEAALAAYNAGPSGVLQALAVKLPAEAVTAGQDYVTWMMSRVGPWLAKFETR